MDLATQRVPTPSLPWRQLGVLALVAILIATIVAVYVGSQPRLPDPFGPAVNGRVVFASAGDIYTADPAGGTSTAIVTGSETDLEPKWSRDGTQVVFERKVDGDTGPGRLYVARSDGSDLTLVTPEPVTLTASLLGEPWSPYEFSPDGRSVLLANTVKGYPTISIAASDGSGIRDLDVDIAAYEPSFRPPDGAEILFVGGSMNQSHGVYAVDVSSGAVRPIVEPPPGYDLAGATWSPDGSRIAYWTWGGPGEGLTAHTHIVAADGTGDRQLPDPPGAVWNAGSEWSNDGTRLFILRGYRPFFEDVRPTIVPADGSSVGVELPYPGSINQECCSSWEWAPDDSAILGTPTDTVGRPMPQVLLDPQTGGVREVPWTSTSDPTWQRLAPPD
jgi:Tol biopolymer transport system component